MLWSTPLIQKHDGKETLSKRKAIIDWLKLAQYSWVMEQLTHKNSKTIC